MTPKEALKNLLKAIDAHGAGTFTVNEDPTRAAIARAINDAKRTLGESPAPLPTPKTPYQQMAQNWSRTREYEIWVHSEALDEPYSSDLLLPGESEWQAGSHEAPLRYRTTMTIPHLMNDTRRAELLNGIHRLLAEYMEETQGDD